MRRLKTLTILILLAIISEEEIIYSQDENNSGNNTAPKAELVTPVPKAEPIITKLSPINLPSKFGEPVSIYTPTNAIAIPIKALTVGFSLSIKYANKTPKGTSV